MQNMTKIFYTSLLALELAATSTIAGPVLSSVTVSAQNPLTIAPGSNAAFVATVTRTGSGNLDAYLSISGLPAGATAAFSPGLVHFTGSTGSALTSTLTISTTAATPVGSYLFMVTAQDGGSFNVVTANGTLNVGTAPPPPVLTSVTLQPDHSAALAATTVPGQTVYVQASFSLAPAAWTTIATNIAGVDGRLSLIDADAAKFSCRFYRLAVPQ